MLGGAIDRGQDGVLDGEGADADGLELLDRAHDVERVAVAVIGIDHHRQIGCPGDAAGLLDEFAQGEQHDVGRAQHGERGDRAGENADLVS